MEKKPILVVMAAGMGSRYGGLKQIDPVGPCGEAILDFSLYDAYEAGFETAVIIIKEAIREDFMALVGKRLENCPMEIRYAFQEQEKMLPPGMAVPRIRGAKPWGTSHAVLCAKDEIGDAPFVVLNADDYYGKSAFRVIYDYMCSLDESQTREYAMVGYQLSNTVSDHGSVARGICQRNGEDYLTAIVERLRVETYPGGIHYQDDDGTWYDLDPDSLVSMNLFGFTSQFLKELEDRFPLFLKYELPKDPAKKEFLLPMTVGRLLMEDCARVKVLSSSDRWYGVTYAADKLAVQEALREMIRKGMYPANGLWNK